MINQPWAKKNWFTGEKNKTFDLNRVVAWTRETTAGTESVFILAYTDWGQNYKVNAKKFLKAMTDARLR